MFMENKNTSTHSTTILAYLKTKGKVCFKFDDAFQALPNLTENTVRKLLSVMTAQQLLVRIKEGVYYVLPDDKSEKNFVPNPFIIADNIVRAKEYYIGYSSALKIHNLSTQLYSKEQIVVATQLKPSEVKIKDISYQFIYHNDKHFFGYTKIAIDDHTKVVCSDLEKTIIDCLFKPHYAGGIVEIAKAIYLSKDKIRYEKLLDYAKKFQSQVVIKRLGFILDILEIDTAILEKLIDLKTASFELLDTSLPKTTTYISKWYIQQNVATKLFKKIKEEGLKNQKLKKIVKLNQG